MKSGSGLVHVLEAHGTGAGLVHVLEAHGTGVGVVHVLEAHGTGERGMIGEIIYVEASCL